MRCISFAVIGMCAITACALPPARGPADEGAAAAAGSPPQPGATASPESVQQRDAVAAAVRAGYTERLVRGQKVYCREETPIGTRFSELHCYTIEQLAAAARQQDRLHDMLARPMVCAGGSTCVAN